jgi:hypothetical protein
MVIVERKLDSVADEFSCDGQFGPPGLSQNPVRSASLGRDELAGAAAAALLIAILLALVSESAPGVHLLTSPDVARTFPIFVINELAGAATAALSVSILLGLVRKPAPRVYYGAPLDAARPRCGVCA